MILEEKKKKILARLNKTMSGTVTILKSINSRIEETVELNKEIIRTIGVYKIWKEKN